MKVRNMRLKIQIICIAIVGIFTMSCTSNDNRQDLSDTTYNLEIFSESDNAVPSSITSTSIVFAKDGLDLQALTTLIKKAKNAKDLEKLLNTPGSINNLDLDKDGKVDYISITEFRDSDNQKRGLSLTVDLGKGQVQEVATIQFERDQSAVNMLVAGNEQIYGSDENYMGGFSFTDLLIMNWLFNSTRPTYSSPYYYAHYPSYYKSYDTIDHQKYKATVSPIASNTQVKRVGHSSLSSLVSPNANKVATTIKVPLSKPTESQRLFQKQHVEGKLSAPGFSSSTSKTEGNINSSASTNSDTITRKNSASPVNTSNSNNISSSSSGTKSSGTSSSSTNSSSSSSISSSTNSSNTSTKSSSSSSSTKSNSSGSFGSSSRSTSTFNSGRRGKW
jgi:hypothetical protein